MKEAVRLELATSLFESTLAAVEIKDLTSGDILFTRNETLLLRPASNAKLFTSAAAVLGLPADFRFETRVAVTDSARKTLVCIGGGDPLASIQDIQKLAEIAQRSGIDHIDTLVMDGSLFGDDYFGSGWMWDDEADPFMPYIDAFSINGNTATIRIKRSPKNNSVAEFSVYPSCGLFHISPSGEKHKKSGFRIERTLRSNDYILHGVPKKGKKVVRKFSIWQPEEVFADLLLSELQKLGIADENVVLLFSAAPTSLLPVGSVGHSITEVLSVMNKESNNLCAEAVLRALSFGTGRKSASVTADDGLKALSSILSKSGVSTSGVALRDGSGISFYNLVTVTAISRILQAIAGGGSFDRYRESLAIAGVDGTLRSRMTTISPPKAFRGKTGTVRGVSALSGYVQAPGGRLLSVVMLMQNFKGKTGPYREVQDRIVKHCIDYSTSFTAKRLPR